MLKIQSKRDSGKLSPDRADALAMAVHRRDFYEVLTDSGIRPPSSLDPGDVYDRRVDELLEDAQASRAWRRAGRPAHGNYGHGPHGRAVPTDHHERTSAS